MAGITTQGTIVRINDNDIGAILSIGDFVVERNTKEYQPLNTGDNIIAIGRIKSGSNTIKVLLNPDDTVQQTLQDAVLDGVTVDFEIELPNKKTDTGNGTKYTWNGVVVSKLQITPDEDGFYTATFDVVLPGEPTITAAA